MQKLVTLFKRDDRGRAYDEVEEGAEWVIAGEGVATQKHDGTCCAVIGGVLYKRMEWKQDKGPAPPQWIHWSKNPEQRSGHGWYPVGDGPEDWAHRAAEGDETPPDGTYELCGVKIQKNPEGLAGVELIRHGSVVIENFPRDFEGIKKALAEHNIEGVVWHHPDGRMVKIKGRDFGIKRRLP